MPRAVWPLFLALLRILSNSSTFDLYSNEPLSFELDTETEYPFVQGGSNAGPGSRHYGYPRFMQMSSSAGDILIIL